MNDRNPAISLSTTQCEQETPSPRLPQPRLKLSYNALCFLDENPELQEAEWLGIGTDELEPLYPCEVLKKYAAWLVETGKAP